MRGPTYCGFPYGANPVPWQARIHPGSKRRWLFAMAELGSAQR